MLTVKEEVKHILENLPDDCTLEDIQYHLFVLQKIENGLEDLKERRVVSQEEVEKKLEKWIIK